MEYFDEEAKSRYVPHVVEPSAGVDRLVLALISRLIVKMKSPMKAANLNQRVVMRFQSRVAQSKLGYFLC
jgi:glycyl-tRNA synthetase